MNSENVRIQTENGHEIIGTVFRPAGETRTPRCVLIAAATGVKQFFYYKFATFLCENGFLVLTFDYYGIGVSLTSSIRKIRNSMQDWGEKDMVAAIKWIKENLRPFSLFFVGHSVGGQLVGLFEDPNVLEKLVFVTSQNGYWRLYQRKKYLYAFLWYTIWPLLTRLLGYFPSKFFRFGENLPKGVARQWGRWCRSRNYLFDDKRVDTGRYALLKSPILSFSFSDDSYAPLGAVQDLLSHYLLAQVEYRHYAPMDLKLTKIGHFGFFRESARERLWPQVVAFFNGEK